MSEVSTEYDVFEVSICQCCMEAAANGETSCEYHGCHEYDENTSDDDKPLSCAEGMIDAIDAEPYFSTSSCDTCNSPLGGNRWNANMSVPQLTP